MVRASLRPREAIIEAELIDQLEAVELDKKAGEQAGDGP
jgi:hypothetical protein